MTDYLNENGLVDGNIPKGSGCPFLLQCKFKTDNCPSDKHQPDGIYSCGAARLFSITTKSKK
jgi:hypothetical protein